MAGSNSTPFWADAFTEPKRKYKFLFELTGDTEKIEPFLVKTAKKPSWEVGEAEHHFLNHTFYYPGKVKWSEMEITVVDPTDVVARLVKILVQTGYPLPANSENFDAVAHTGLTYEQAIATTVSKARGVGAVGNVKLTQMAPAMKVPEPRSFAEGQDHIAEQWTLHNAWMKNVDFGDLSYEDEGMSEITMTIRYDWATLTGGKAASISWASGGGGPTTVGTQAASKIL